MYKLKLPRVRVANLRKIMRVVSRFFFFLKENGNDTALVLLSFFIHVLIGVSNSLCS